MCPHTKSDERSTSIQQPPVYPSSEYKTILILGASYGGARAARVISESLVNEKLDGWRVVLVDRNSHANHVYVFPRFTLLPHHAIKAFIPYQHLLFQPPSDTDGDDVVQSNLFIRGHVLSLTKKSAKIRIKNSDGSDDLIDLPYEYLIYALGSTLPEPVDPWHTLSQLLSQNTQSTSSNDISLSQAQDIDVSSLSVDLPSIESRPPSPTLPPTPLSTTSSFSQLKSSQPSSYFTAGEVSPWLPLTPPCSTPEFHPQSFGKKALTGSSGSTSREALRLHADGAGSLQYGLEWMKGRRQMVKTSKRVIVLGGGALGIQFATDIKELFPEKEVTLLHSRDRLLPIYPEEMHETIVARCIELGINLVLGERAQSTETKVVYEDGQERPEVVVTTSKGRVIEGDMILQCTGQRPNTAIIASFLPHTLSDVNHRLSVRRTMQLSPPSTSEDSSSEPIEDRIEDRIFAIGDCADAFGAIQSGNAAYWQANVASRNVLRLIQRQDGSEAEALEEYKPNPPMIKVTLGLTRYVKYIDDKVTKGDDGQEDLSAKLMWYMFGAAELAEQLADREVDYA